MARPRKDAYTDEPVVQEEPKRPAIKSERRRRNSDALSGARRRLSVDESKLDRENFVYRFANDAPGRIHTLTVDDDWEVVTDRTGELKPDATGLGAGVSFHAGTGDAGAPVNAVLLRKPKVYADEDAAAKQRQIDATEESLREAKTPGGDGSGQYVPEGREIKIGRG